MSNQDRGNDQMPYRLRGNFLSSPEMALLRVLQQMSNGRFVICPKVSLNDIFYIIRPNENVHFYNKIFRKHVDFLLCEPRAMSPAFGVEMVKPIAKDNTRASDQFMEDLFLSVGIPLVHVPSSDSYQLADIVNLFKLAALKVKQFDPIVPSHEEDSVPLCPKCGLMMVLRIHRGGPNAGKKYYGCMNSPECGGLVPID